MTAEDVIETMESMLDSDQRTVLMRFFRTAKGEYGEGDEFLGIKTPQTRKVVKECKSLPMSEVPTLLKNKWHEVRLCGLLILSTALRLPARKGLPTPTKPQPHATRLCRCILPTPTSSTTGIW